MSESETLARRISATAWRGYNATDTDEMIRADFLRRYGVLPAEILRGDACATVLAGPVPETPQTPPEVKTTSPPPKRPYSLPVGV